MRGKLQIRVNFVFRNGGLCPKNESLGPLNWPQELDLKNLGLKDWGLGPKNRDLDRKNGV